MPNGPVVTLAGLFDDAYLAETGFFRRIAAAPGAGTDDSGTGESWNDESGAGGCAAADAGGASGAATLVTTAPPVAYGATPASIRRPPSAPIPGRCCARRAARTT